MIGCEGVRELAQGYLDGALAPDERGRFERHLHACPACRHVVATYERLYALLAEPAVPEPRPGFVGRTMARVAVARRWRRRLQTLVAVAAMALVGGVALVLAWGEVGDEVAAQARDLTAPQIWATAWNSALAFLDGVAAVGSDALSAVPGGTAILVALAAMLGAQLILVSRWRALAQIHDNQARRSPQ